MAPKGKKMQWFKKIKNNCIFGGLKILIFTLQKLPFGMVSVAGKQLGQWAFYIAQGERKKTIQNLKLAFKDKYSEKEINEIAKSVFVNLGKNFFEMINWSAWSKDRVLKQIVRHYGFEHLQSAVNKKKGVLAVTAHLGNWELLAAYISAIFPVAVIAQKLYDPRLNQMINQFRENWGCEIIQRGAALKKILKALKNNKVIGVLADQDTGNDGIFVHFFNKLAWTQTGIARIAIKTGCAIVPVFIVRGASGQFEIHIESEIHYSLADDESTNIRNLVQQYTEIIQNYVSRFPDQWVWMHERWRTQPIRHEI
jgi:KDO2-lipid IV(A) lauroyltransferase